MRLIAILLFSLPLTLFADRIVLKNGKEYRGTFVDGDAGLVKFRIGKSTIRTFQANDISRLEIGSPRPAAAEMRRSSPVGTADRDMPRSTPRMTPVEVVQVPANNQPFVTAPAAGTVGANPVQGAAALDSEYTRTGSATGPLGKAVGPNQPTADRRASVRFFENGAIYWTQQGGAHTLSGPILDAWVAQGGERSQLGYPSGDEEVTEGGFTRRQPFEKGTILWTQDKGAVVQFGAGR